MSEFYLSDVKDLVRCQGSMAEQKRVVVVGTVGDKTKPFKGVVEAINEDRISNPRRWRITMRDQ
jgi:hypothetical protein